MIKLIGISLLSLLVVGCNDPLPPPTDAQVASVAATCEKLGMQLYIHTTSYEKIVRCEPPPVLQQKWVD